MKFWIVTIAALMFLITANVMAQEVSVNYDHNKSFSGYHTYAWASENANKIQNSILAQVAQRDINTALQEKGLQMVPEDQNPDLIVTGNGGMQKQTSYTSWNSGPGWGGMSTITPQESVQGTMIVDLYDAKNKALVWRGVAQNTLSDKGEKNQKTVSKAVEKMFKQWPKS